MTHSTGRARALAALALAVALAAGCALPAPTPSPTASAGPSAADKAAAAAQAVARTFVTDWRAQRYDRVSLLIAPTDRERYRSARIIRLLRSFDSLAEVTSVVAEAGPAVPSSMPSESGAEGPIPTFDVPIYLSYETDRFGTVSLRRTLIVGLSADKWVARWRPSLLFPDLGDDDTLALERTPAPRGRIVAASGAVFAETRADGKRVYPQEWLAGQTIGYATPVTADELPTLPRAAEYQLGDLLGRSGLEQRAETLLRGTAGLAITAVPADGAPVPMLERAMVPGADLTITIRPDLQATAEAAIGGYPDAATAVIDPKTGDVWALASAPLFNPNAMTLGTSLGGQPLPKPPDVAILNKATMTAYPAGSSFKPFTLLAALKTGVATPATRMSCYGTWTFSGFTFHNYMDHTLGGSVSLEQAMAFSCNTTYMPLSIRVWDKDRTALTDLVGQFGFGQSTGITYLADNPGVLPDADYFDKTPRWDDHFDPYGPFDQIQLAIGQGSFLGTPLQLANAYAAFGNGGKLWQPRLVSAATLPDGTVIEADAPRLIRQVDIAPQHLAFLAQALRAVSTLPYGTAYFAFAGFGIPVAGKSGTAETGTPTPDAWFPAYAPIGDAEISVATVLVHVKLATGGTDAAPLVRRVMATYFANK